MLTALPIELKAVKAHLTKVGEESHPEGTVYAVGEFAARDGAVWKVCVAQTGTGNMPAAMAAERAIAYFQPQVAFFVGIAGGLKDVALGDVVAATDVYGYESGRAAREFLVRPTVGKSSYRMVERARAEVWQEDWLQRVGGGRKPGLKVYVGPIVAGEKVLASKHAAIYRFVRDNYSNALAIEMEGSGFLEAMHANQQVDSLVVRGISDLINDKAKRDKSGWQQTAARHASAFAFEILSKLKLDALRADKGVPTDVAATAPAWPKSAPTDEAINAPGRAFRRNSKIDQLIKDVQLGVKGTSAGPALQIVSMTNEGGQNQLLELLLDYQDSPDEDDTLWQALSTIESCAELAPLLFTRPVLHRMASHENFSVRSSAASICMSLAQYAPELVPVDMLLKLSVYSEDWYVETPANAALKAMVRAMPAVQGIFFQRLHSSVAEERLHAAGQIADIADEEPGLLQPTDILAALTHLRAIGDKEASEVLSKSLPKVCRAKRTFGYKYGL